MFLTTKLNILTGVLIGAGALLLMKQVSLTVRKHAVMMMVIVYVMMMMHVKDQMIVLIQMVMALQMVVIIVMK